MIFLRFIHYGWVAHCLPCESMNKFVRSVFILLGSLTGFWAFSGSFLLEAASVTLACHVQARASTFSEQSKGAIVKATHTSRHHDTPENCRATGPLSGLGGTNSFDQAIHVAVKIGIGPYIDTVSIGKGLQQLGKLIRPRNGKITH